MVVARAGPTRIFHSIGSVLDPKVFKAYDVRGIYPEDLDERGAYAIGRAYVQQFEPRRIAVGRDMRVSSKVMAAELMRGAICSAMHRGWNTREMYCQPRRWQ